MNTKQQKTHNRRILETQAIAEYRVRCYEPWNSQAMQAHLALNSLLEQDDIDVLREQMVEACCDKARRNILIAWYTWYEADQKAKKANLEHTGYAGNALRVWIMVGKAEMLHEWLVAEKFEQVAGFGF